MISASDSPHLGADAHSRRVAAYCDQLAAARRMPVHVRTQLRQMALWHNRGSVSWRAVEALLGECLHSDHPHTQRAAPPAIPPVSEILEMANQFDEFIEHVPYTGKRLTDSLTLPSNDMAVEYVLPDLRRCTRDSLRALIRNVPVCPEKGLEVAHLMARRDIVYDDVLRIVAGDPVLTGSILQVANSALFARPTPVRDIAHAISFIGPGRAAQVALTAALKPVITVRGGEPFWQHSETAARIAEVLARLTRHIDPGHAWVVGLLHDVGKLLLSLVPAEFEESKRKLTASGVPEQVAEAITFGADHAAAGADVLRAWRLAADFVEAVEFHHEPEHSRSPLAALLYLVEFCTGSDEDIPSAIRMEAALKLTGLEMSDLHAVAATKTEAGDAGDQG